MNHFVPDFIFVPHNGVETGFCSSQEELSDQFYCCSRWTEGKPRMSLSPPKPPPRRQELDCDCTNIVKASAIDMPSSPISKTDSLPKLPRRSSAPNTTAVASADTIRQRRRRYRRVRSIPTLLLSEQLQHQRQVFTRSIPMASIPIASRIVERAHQKTRRHGPRRITVIARAA